MKIITVVQTKGGSGKTTLLMSLASAALAKGKKVAMMDGDLNKQLLKWPNAYQDADWGQIEKPEWPESLHIEEPPTNVEALYERNDELEDLGFDYIFIDTRPGSYQDTEDLALAADLVLIPAKPVQAEWRLVVEAYDWMAKLSETIQEGDHFPQVKTVLNNVSKAIANAATQMDGAKGVPKDELAVLQQILQTPHLSSILPTSKIFEKYFHHGPLTLAIEARSGKAPTATFEGPLDLATYLLEEIEEVLE